MVNREKVIKGLYACTTFGENGVTDGDCKICPYNKGYATGECWVQMNRDAIELLKEQEAVKPRRIDGKRNHFIRCGNCNYDLVTGYLFCPHCGKAVADDA